MNEDKKNLRESSVECLVRTSLIIGLRKRDLAKWERGQKIAPSLWGCLKDPTKVHSEKKNPRRNATPRESNYFIIKKQEQVAELGHAMFALVFLGSFYELGLSGSALVKVQKVVFWRNLLLREFDRAARRPRHWLIAIVHKCFNYLHWRKDKCEGASVDLVKVYCYLIWGWIIGAVI